MVRALTYCFFAFLLVGCFGGKDSNSHVVNAPGPKGNGEPWTGKTGAMIQVSHVGFYDLENLAAAGQSDGIATVVGLNGEAFSWVWQSTSKAQSEVSAIQSSSDHSIVLVKKPDHYEVVAINRDGKQDWSLTLPVGNAELKAVALSADGMYIAVAGNDPDPVAFVYEKSGNLKQTLESSHLQGNVGTVAFLPNSHSLVAGSTSVTGARVELFKRLGDQWQSSLTSFFPGTSLKFADGSGKTATDVRLGLSGPIETGHLATFETLVNETKIGALTPVGVYENLPGKLFVATGDAGTFVFHTNDPDGRIISGDSEFSWNLLYELFKKAFGSHVGDANYNEDFDYDKNGVVNNGDYNQFKLKYGSFIVPTTPPPPPPQANPALFTGSWASSGGVLGDYYDDLILAQVEGTTDQVSGTFDCNWIEPCSIQGSVSAYNVLYATYTYAGYQGFAVFYITDYGLQGSLTLDVNPLYSWGWHLSRPTE